VVRLSVGPVVEDDNENFAASAVQVGIGIGVGVGVGPKGSGITTGPRAAWAGTTIDPDVGGEARNYWENYHSKIAIGRSGVRGKQIHWKQVGGETTRGTTLVLGVDFAGC